MVDSARLGIDAGAGTSVTIRPERRAVILAGQAGDLYLPVDARAALLMVPGVTPQGRDDPRLVAFAAALSGHGFLVFVPDLPDLRAQRVGPEDPAAIARAAAALATCLPDDRPQRLAASGISYAVAPLVLAALTQPGGERIAAILGIGGYYDVVAAITYLTTGYYRETPGGPWRAGAPEPIARWVFVLASALQVPEPRDRELLTGIAQARLADPNAPVAGLAAGLGPDGRAMLALAENTDPERVPALIAALPAAVRSDLHLLDLKRYPLADLRADLILVHGHDDPLIPASESRALAAAVPEGRARVYVVGNLRHVDIAAGGLGDALLLWQAAYRLLTLRDGLSVPESGRCALATTSGSG